MEKPLLPVQSDFKSKRRPSSCCHPTKWPYRVTLLFLTCYVQFLCYYCNESPGGLEDTIIKVMGIDTTQYNLLFLVTTWPNILVSVIGGVIADRFLGRRVSYVILILIILTGTFLWSAASFFDLFWVVLLGRFFIGIGATLIPAVTVMFFINWFGKKYFTLVVSIGGTSARIGGAAALAVPQFINEQLYFVDNPSYRLGATILVGAGLACIGLMVGVSVAVMDKYRETFKAEKTKKVERSKMKCSDLKQFDDRFWLTAIIIIYYSIVFAFTSIGQVFYVQKYSLSLVEASIANSFVFSATILATPVIGYIVNAIGHHILWTMVSIASALAVHVVLLITSPGLTYLPYITGILYSASYTIVAASYWPLVGLIVEKSQIATAYGIMCSMNNLFWGLLSIVSGFIVDISGYFVLEIMYSSLLFLVLMISVLVLMIDLVSERSVVNAPGTWTQ